MNVTMDDKGSALPFVSSEKLLCDILVPEGRDAVVIRSAREKPIELVQAANGISKGGMLLFISKSPTRALLTRLLAPKLLGLRAFGTYVVMPSEDRPRLIVPWRGKASRIFFRNEAASPYNGPAKYRVKWLLASLGIAPLLQRCFIIVCGRD